MRRLIIFALFFIGFNTFAQQNIGFYYLHPEQLYGVYSLGAYSKVSETKTPKGYEPFYISHYARHGARYQDSEEAYTKVIEELEKAEQNNALTELGKSVLKRTSDYYELCTNRRGELTSIGFRQHEGMAKGTYCKHTKTFNNAIITACSSFSRRCIMSMQAFCLGLKGCKPSLNIYPEVSRTCLDDVNPGDKENPAYKKTEDHHSPWNDNWEQFGKRIITRELADNIAGRLFTKSYLASLNTITFTDRLYNFAAGTHCVDCNINLDDIFSTEEKYAYWRKINAGYYEWSVLHREAYKPILKNMINLASEDIATGKNIVRLRFGHDTNLQAMLTMLGAFDMAVVPESIDDLHKTWQCWRTPMAATLELVFYHSKKNPRILFKALLNGEEIPLSTMKPVKYPYYDFEDLKKVVYSL